MNNIDRYIVGTFLSSYAILLLVGMGSYVFGDVIFNLDEFTENPGDSAVDVLIKMVDFHGYRLPLYFHQLGGLMLAIAASFTFAILLKNNELTPLVAAGVPLQRLLVPVLMSSVVLVALWLVNGELIVPAYATKIARHHDDLGRARETGVVCLRDDNNAILSATEFHMTQGRLKQVYIIEPDAGGNPRDLISADYAYYDAGQQTWRLVRGSRLTLDPAFETDNLGQPVLGEPVESYAFSLNPEQILLRQSSQWAELMSLRQMNDLLQSHNLPNLPAVAKARDIRFSQPLLMWILVLLAVPFFLTREPANVLVAGGKALLLAGSCFGFAFIAHSMPYTQVAIALPVLIFGPVAVLHVANVKT